MSPLHRRQIVESSCNSNRVSYSTVRFHCLVPQRGPRCVGPASIPIILSQDRPGSWFWRSDNHRSLRIDSCSFFVLKRRNHSFTRLGLLSGNRFDDSGNHCQTVGDRSARSVLFVGCEGTDRPSSCGQSTLQPRASSRIHRCQSDDAGLESRFEDVGSYHRAPRDPGRCTSLSNSRRGKDPVSGARKRLYELHEEDETAHPISTIEPLSGSFCCFVQLRAVRPGYGICKTYPGE